MLRKTEDIIAYAVEKKVPDTLSFVKTTFRPDCNMATLEDRRKEAVSQNAKTNLDLYFQIDDYIKCKTGKVSSTTIGVYGTMKSQLVSFQDYRKAPITFDSLDYNFYETFVDYLTHEYVQARRKKVTKGLKQATIGKTIKQLRIFIKDRVRRKIVSPIDLSDFKILDEESDAVYLNWEEINKVFQVDLTEYPDLVKYRDCLLWDALQACVSLTFRVFALKIYGGKCYIKSRANRIIGWLFR